MNTLNMHVLLAPLEGAIHATLGESQSSYHRIHATPHRLFPLCFYLEHTVCRQTVVLRALHPGVSQHVSHPHETLIATSLLRPAPQSCSAPRLLAESRPVPLLQRPPALVRTLTVNQETQSLRCALLENNSEALSVMRFLSGGRKNTCGHRESWSNIIRTSTKRQATTTSQYHQMCPTIASM